MAVFRSKKPAESAKIAIPGYTYLLHLVDIVGLKLDLDYAIKRSP